MAPKKPSTMDIRRLKPSETAIAIKTMIKVNLENAKIKKGRRGLFIWGPPGIAKSSIAAQVAEEMNYKLIDIRLTQMEPTDLRGIPVPVKNDVTKEVTVSWAAPEFLPRRDKGVRTGTLHKPEVDRRTLADGSPDPTDTTYAGAIILLDELPNAAPSVQAGSYQLVLDGKLGEYIVPDNVVVFAAGNRETDKGSTFKMPTPLMNRFVHVEMTHDFDDWQAHAMKNGFDKDIVGFLSTFNDKLMKFDATSASRGFATPRTWDFYSDILRESAGVPNVILEALGAGCIGDGISLEFLAYRRSTSQLPSARDILDGKIKSSGTTDISLKYALTVSLCYELKERHEKSARDAKLKKVYNESMNNFLGFMLDDFAPELVVMGTKSVLSTFDLPISSPDVPNFKNITAKYGKLIMKA